MAIGTQGKIRNIEYGIFIDIKVSIITFPRKNLI